nr:putative ribonuclease H-like domain-containing protein [Tanacetum cinerariifolium]
MQLIPIQQRVPEYVVPTGRVIVPTGRYAVPAGRVIVPAGRYVVPADDARDIWNTVKARFGGNAESKKTRKSMLKQEFSEFRIGEVEGLHKRYDRMQKNLSQLNKLKAKPEDEDINLKFLRALPLSWSQVALTLKTKGGLELFSFDDLYYKLKTLEVDVKEYTNFSSSQSIGPSHSAFVSTTSASKKISYEDSPSYCSTTTYTAPSNSKTGSYRSGNVIEDGLQSFVADTEPEQLAYEDFKQIEKLDLEEMDLKWQMAMLSIDHDGESDGVITYKKFGMIAGCDTKDAIKEGAAKIYNLIIGADTKEASTAGDAGEFALMRVTSETYTPYVPTMYSNHMKYGVDRWATAVKPSAGYSWKSHRNGLYWVPKNNSGSHTSKWENPIPDAEDEGVFDSGCSRSMTGNKKRLDDFQEFQGGKVTFGGGEGRITRKGTIRTPTLDFENVYYVKELQQFNLFSISQICDKKNSVLFTDTECLVLSKDFKLPDESMVVLRVPKKHNLYTINLNNLCLRGNLAYLVASASVDEPVNSIGGWVMQETQASYKAITAVSFISEPLQLLHMDLFGPTSIRRIDHKYYCLVITDDYKRFCWVFFLEHKDETYPILKDFINLVENQLNKKVKAMRCDNGTKFKNSHIIELCGSKGIKREYSNARTPQQNWVAERKKRTLIEAARTMLADSKLPNMFWTKAIRTACYVLNRVLVTSPHNKTSYALLTGNIPSVSHFKPFGCHVTILNTSDHLGKFDGKADEGYIVGYFASNKVYKVYNVPNKRVEETMNLRFLEEKTNVHGLGHEWYFDLDYLTDTLGYKHVQANQYAGTQEAITNPAGIEPKDTSSDEVYDSPLNSTDEFFQKELARLKGQEQRATSDAESLGLGFANDADVIHKRESAKTVPPGSIPVPTGSIPIPSGDTMVSTDDVPVHTSSSTDSFFDDEPTTRFLSPSDLGNHDPPPGIFSSSSYDDEFGAALNNVASTVEVSPVATKRINTIHPQSLIIGDQTLAVQMRSKALEDPSWVDATQEEMQLFKFQDVWVLVDLPAGKYAIGTKWILKNKRDARGIVVRNKARLVAQGHRQEEGIDYDEVFAPMDVKSAFLYGRIDEKQRPDGMFISQDKYVQEILNKFDLGSVRMTTTPYEAPKPKSKNESDSPVNVHLNRSMLGSLMYLTTSRPDIMFAVSTCSRNQVTPTTSNLEAVKKIFKYLKGQPKLGLWYPKESPFVLEAYSDRDYVGANKDRKSTTGGFQFLGRRLILWQCKKQTIVATSSTEAEYVAAANSCGQPTGSRGWISNCQVLHMDKIIDFLRASYIRSPELGPPAIQATIDKTPYTITEDLVRSQLQLADDGGKLTFFKNKFLPQWRFLVHTILHCLSTKFGSWDQFGSPLVVALICLSDGRQFNRSSYIFKGMVSNIGNAKKLLMYPRFLQAILGTETRIKRQYNVLQFSSKLFANMRLNFKGHPMPLIPAMLFQDQEGEGAGVATQAIPQHMPVPDQPHDHLPTPPRQQTSDPNALVFEHGQSSDPNIASFSRTHETDDGPSTNMQDEPLGGSFHISPPRSTPTPLAGYGGKVGQEGQSNGGKTQDIEKEDGSVTVDSNISPCGASDKPAASTSVPANVPTGASNVEANASLSKKLLGDDVSEDNFPARMATLIKRKKQALAEKLAKERQDRPMTQGQQRTYMRQFIQKAISNIQIQAFSRTLKRTGPVLVEPSSERQKSTEAPIPSVPETFIKVFFDEDSEDEAPRLWSALVGWEVITTPLGDINALYGIDRSIVYFTTIRKILHMMDRQDLVKLYGLVVKYYENHPVAGAGLILSWRLYTLSNVYVMETVSGEVVYMFANVSYPLSVNLMERMLRHKLEIDKDVVGNDMTTAAQLIQFIKNQLAAAKVSLV